MKHIGRTESYIECERAFEWRKWASEIPSLGFPCDWKIRIIPPFGGALVRFVASTEHDTSVSVYLDAYDQLGCMGMKPYWEIYPSVDGDTARILMGDEEGLITAIQESLDHQKPKGVL